MTTAEVFEHPGRVAMPTYHLYGSKNLTVTDGPPEEKLFTAAEVLDIAVAAYGKGLTDGRADAARDRWRELAESFRAARLRAEVASMKEFAVDRYERRGYPQGYDYRGSPVDWETGLPHGSACAWVRRQRLARSYDLAGGNR